MSDRLAELRRAAGYSQHQFAPLTHYTRSTIANVEVGRQQAPRAFWQLCDDLLSAGGTLISDYDHLQALIRGHHEQVAHALRHESEEHSDIGDHPQHSDLARYGVPFDPMRRRTLVTWGLATTTAGGLGLVSVGAVGVADITRLQRTEARLQRLDHRMVGRACGNRLWRRPMRATSCSSGAAMGQV